MAQQSLFWDGNMSEGTGIGDAGPYDANLFSQFVMAAFLEKTGVISGLAVVANTPNNNQIVVQPGKAVVQGKLLINDAAATLTIPANASGNPRIDRVMVQADWANQTVRLVLVQGIEIVAGRLLLAANRSVARAVWVTSGAAICAISTAWLVPKFGIVAAIATTTAAYLLVDAMYLRSLLPFLRNTPPATLDMEGAQRTKVAA